MGDQSPATDTAKNEGNDPVGDEPTGSAPTGTTNDESTHRRVILGAGLCVVERDDHTVQIGSEPSRCIVVHNLPPGAATVLSGLDGSDETAEVVRRLKGECGGDDEMWSTLLEELCAAGFVHTVASASSADGYAEPVLRPERVPLARNYGPDRAQIFLTRRSDATVVIAGAGRVATSISSILVSAGIGHVHVVANRPLMPTDSSPAGLPADWGVDLTDKDRLAAVAHRVRPKVATHQPSVHAGPPDLVILADDGPPDSVDAMMLVHESVPHLSAYATAARGVVGPLVLPGRSSCLQCEQLHRTGWDPSWPSVIRASAAALSVPTSCLATAVAAAAADQAVQFIDGRNRPATINGTLEWEFDDWRPRRRSWTPHPQCLCQSTAPATAAVGG